MDLLRQLLDLQPAPEVKVDESMVHKHRIGEKLGLDCLKVGMKEYDSSASATEDMMTMLEMAEALHHALTSPAWVDWMKQTDSNFGLHVSPTSKACAEDAEELAKSLESLIEDLDKAQ
jgi:hypothetical protein